MDASQVSAAGSLSYGLVIANSQEIDVTGRYVARRHAIQVGGSGTPFFRH